MNLLKNIKFNSRIQTGLVLIVFAIVINHLKSEDNLPTNVNYNFPLLSSLSSVLLGVIVLLIAEVNFLFYNRRYFTSKVDSKSISNFLFSSLFYIAILYVPVYTATIYLTGHPFSFYNFFLGLTITLLLSLLSIIILYARPIYRSHKLILTEGKLQISKSGTTTLIPFNEILYFYSENKLVYLTNLNGKDISTDFTLSSLEEKLNSEIFFRASRQIILHHQSVKKYSAIENGKLEVVLKEVQATKNTNPLIISRYKKRKFLDWFNNAQ